MSVDQWRGPGGTDDAPASGDFLLGENWSTGFVPDASTDASLAAGLYTVTLDGVAQVAALTIGAGAELDLASENAALAIRDGSIVAGTLRLHGGALEGDGLLEIGHGGRIKGWGTIDAAVVAHGAVRALLNPDDAAETLRFTGATEFTKRIAGDGTLELSGGFDTISTSHVSVDHLLIDGAWVELKRDITYDGVLTMVSGVLDLTDTTMKLTGSLEIINGSISDQYGDLMIAGDLHAHRGTALVDDVHVGGSVRIDHGGLYFGGVVVAPEGVTIGTHGTLGIGRFSSAHIGSVTFAGDHASMMASSGLGTTSLFGFDRDDSIDFYEDNIQGKPYWVADQDGIGGILHVRVSNYGVYYEEWMHFEENHTADDFVLTPDHPADLDGVTGFTVTLAEAAFAIGGSRPAGDVAHGGGHLFAAAHDLHAVTALA